MIILSLHLFHSNLCSEISNNDLKCFCSFAGRCDNTRAVVRALSSSSSLDAGSPPAHSQLNYTAGSSWCASSNDPSPYLEIDLGSDYVICAVVTRGNSQADQWVKTYRMQTSKNQSSWSDYKEDGQVKVISKL